MPDDLPLPLLVRSLYPRHPARRMPFDDLYAGLRRALADNRVFVTSDPASGLELFGYTRSCVFDRRWDLFSLIARGLIVDPAARRVVATPFPKFFNYGEGGCDLPDEPFEATEKVDGSLGILFHHGGRWRVVTRGAFASDQAARGDELLRRGVRTDALTAGTTYLVEIVYAENRIVVPYDFEGLALLAAYDEAGDELPRAALDEAARAAGLRRPRTLSFASVPDLLAAAGSLGRDEEGFVLRFAGGLRVKVKGEEYCRVHRLMCHCSPLAMWEAMMNGDDLDALRRDLPEEMHGDFDAIRALTAARFDSLLAEVASAREATAHLSNKELGLMVRDDASPLTPAARKFLFPGRRPGELRRKLFQMIRPAGNRLPGYSPSRAATRFRSEQE